MNIVFFGTSAFGIPTLEALRATFHHLSLVVTTPSKPKGRGLKVAVSPIGEWAKAHGFPLVEWDREDTAPLLEQLKTLKPDLFVVTSFGVILKNEFLVLPKIAPVNLHASLLPKYRGASPMQMAILGGETETGVSLMRMVSQCDAGDVMAMRRLSLTPDDTTPTLEQKLSRLAAEMLIEALPILSEGRAVWVPQDATKATLCSKIEKSQGRIDWKRSARQLDREVRAFTGWPGSYFFYQGKRISIGQATVASEERSLLQPGKIDRVSPSQGVVVACGEGTLGLRQLQLEGRKMLPVTDFLRGFDLKIGDFLE